MIVCVCVCVLFASTFHLIKLFCLLWILFTSTFLCALFAFIIIILCAYLLISVLIKMQKINKNKIHLVDGRTDSLIGGMIAFLSKIIV